MADEEKKDEEGNLPPLSDFDSQGDQTSDGGLPPLSSFDTDDPNDTGGLPPISDIEVETPEPAGGNIKPPPAGFEDTMDTPAPSDDMMASPGSFQDLAADSDFAPETPELGPGPSSGMDTPTFDTAFGGGFESPASTPAPTQAMETPMFGGAAPEQGGGGFEAGAFGGGDFGGSDFGGTPAPDFTPDTGMGGAAAPPPMMDTPQPAGRGGGGGMGMGIVAVVAILMLVGGIFAGPFVADQGFMGWMPNPTRTALEDVQSQLSTKDSTIRQLRNQLQVYEDNRNNPNVGQAGLTQDELDDLRDKILAAEQELSQINGNIETRQASLRAVERDLDEKSRQVFEAEEKFLQLDTATKITEARKTGLDEEVERLTGMVGSLTDASIRSKATKEALLSNAEILLTNVRESLPLTPARYDYNKRVERAEALRNMIASAAWVTPSLMDAYNKTAQEEIVISKSREYFFAKLKVTDRFGTSVDKWCECLMNGNWSVDYRSLDGKNIGTFENLADYGENPLWGYNEDLPKETQKAIEGSVIAARTDDYLEKVQFLAEKQIAEEGDTSFQRNFDSL